MQYDNNGFARYKEGDYAVITRPETDYHAGWWNEKLESMVGRKVRIIVEDSDSDGYYYEAEDVGFAIDIAFLRPPCAFELSDDEEDITEVNMSAIIGTFRVVN